MSNRRIEITGGPSLLFLVFLVLKLTDHIDWSWAWVTAPLWIPAAVAFVVLCAVGLGAAIASSYRGKKDE